MAIERIPISRSQLCELLGVDLARFIDVERQPSRREDQRGGRREPTGWQIVMEAEEMTQPSGVFPQLNQGGKKIGGGKKGGKKC